ncbi:hypothetical protein [Streptosporangium canum]|uniref:hypothetical protein n=1 Tax=Streptosporangium canum TaxID=324952 RepID=UPI001160537F|nr:hypothetical protein [Streptosporangium canum]
MTDGGTGSALFAEDPDTAAQLIAGEVDNLLAKVAQAASVTIRTHRPVHTVHVFGRLPFVQLADGSTMIELGRGERFNVVGSPSPCGAAN